MTTPRPMTLILLDGFGHSTDTKNNAIALANTPFLDSLYKNYAHTLISGSGTDVGLPQGQMGNSEVGHLNIGAGRLVQQDFTRVQSAIDQGDFFKNPVLTKAMDKAVSKGKQIHILGLLSPGGVHSHENHLRAAIELSVQRKAKNVYLHAFLDGRDTPQQSGATSLTAFDTLFQQHNCGRIASIIGRYYAMDRDKRWDRVAKAYDLLTQGKGYTETTATAALQAAYDRGENDEFVQGSAITPAGDQPVTINDGDVVIFMNYRADRARELTEALTSATFDGFQREKIPALSQYVCLTEYKKDFKLPTAFPPCSLNNVLGEYLASLNKSQLRIAETEKYAHVTFFFNGGVEAPFPQEDRLLIPSPHVATYDLQPEMSAPELTRQLVEKVESQHYDAIICNYANADMVGHTGNLEAAKMAIETLDHCLQKVVTAIQSVGGEVLITADHGNAEKMFNEKTGQPHTAHTSDPVPLIYVGRKATFTTEQGTLSDLAPTMLYCMGLKQPKEMTGKNLLAFS